MAIPRSRNAANFDESKVSSKPNLPEPLVSNNGERVTFPKMWWTVRRPEIVEAFDREIYGRVPSPTPSLTWEVFCSTSEEVVPVTRKKLVGHGDNSSYPLIRVDIQLTLTMPAKATGPVPVIMELGLRPEAWPAIQKRIPGFFESDKFVDARQLGIEGLSRYGKAALVAMAYDQRFAIGFIGSSGRGGAKILWRNFGEQVENLASSSEYHWMAGNFLKYARPLHPSDLPVDAPEPVALCAPRPVFIGSGSQQVEGGWVDAKGMFLGAVGAGPVYELLGKQGLGTSELPPIETALSAGDIAWRQHSGGHTNGPNWPTFLEFAGHYLKATQGKTTVGGEGKKEPRVYSSAADARCASTRSACSAAER